MAKNGSWHHDNTNLAGLLGFVAVANGVAGLFFGDAVKIVVLVLTLIIVGWAVYQMAANKKAGRA